MSLGSAQYSPATLISGPWIDRTQLYCARKRREEITEADVTTYYAVTLTPPPLWSHLGR